MIPSIRDKSARARDGNSTELLPRSVRHGSDRGAADGDDAKDSASSSTPVSSSTWEGKKNRDKIRCLDGLRGIACLIVFNYHFLWPWTPSIMMGYGALPPRSAEPYWGLHTLPIVCLLHRGRPMVAIFFAISGYVLCRHILRLIHERRIDVAYQKLASAVFRRVFRLYIPPTISMFLVAMLAQMGAFRSETDIYKGPDSVYINATIYTADLKLDNHACVNGTAISGAAGLASYMSLQNTNYLTNISDWTDKFCVNDTSRLYGPSQLYQLVAEYEAEYEALHPKNTTNGTELTTTLTKNVHKTKKEPSYLDKAKSKLNFRHPSTIDLADGLNKTDGLNLTWVKLGGSWEEHPFIHDNITYALQNFTRVYAEWANPFNFGHYHTHYDPHTFTIPMELRGSMFIYLFLLGTAALKQKYRLRIAGFLSAYSLTLGRWDMATFMGGTVLSEMDVWSSADPNQSSPNERTLDPPVTGASRFRKADQRSGRKGSAMRLVRYFIALYFLSYPDAGAEYTPGFVILSYLVPKYYIPLSGWMFYQAMGALLLIHCVLRTPSICRILEGRTAQYLGKISFSFYLVHGPVLHSLGFWIMPRLFDAFGKPVAFVIGYVVLLTVALYLTRLWHQKVDTWSVTVGRRVESMFLE